ncbi:MAG: acetylxylan esterase [Ancalomicrobiaceae bacterium]|nr:acetylxylan esterase [Ancalomicrobiaceae bacterium]
MSIPTDHPYDFDPSYGLGLEALRAIRPPEAPPGFDDFWRARYRRALAVDPRPSVGTDVAIHANWLVHDIVYASTDGFEIGGWLMLPRDGKVRRGLVVGHGYGGRDQPDFDVPVEETAVLFPCFRGISRSARAPISPDPSFHVLHDIDSPERYIIGGCVEDLWLAVSALLRLYPELAGRIGYSGVSLGGGIGALAIAFDARIDRGHLGLPTFGNRPLWLTLPTVGSAHAVQQFQWTHGPVLQTLRLFDAATAATRIRVPMLVAVARFDPAVAPPCQFSVANALPTSNDHEIVILDAGHCDYPGSVEQNAALLETLRRFFRVT